MPPLASVARCGPHPPRPRRYATAVSDDDDDDDDTFLPSSACLRQFIVIFDCNLGPTSDTPTPYGGRIKHSVAVFTIIYLFISVFRLIRHACAATGENWWLLLILTTRRSGYRLREVTFNKFIVLIHSTLYGWAHTRSDWTCYEIETASLVRCLDRNIALILVVRRLWSLDNKTVTCPSVTADGFGILMLCTSLKLKNFYRSSNSIFCKVGRAASEEVVLHLIKTKCLPVLLYGLEVFSLTKS